MLEYEWGNPSSIMLTGDTDNPPDTDLNRHVLDPYATHHFNESSSFFNPNDAQYHDTHHQQQPPQPFIGSHQFHQSIYDPLGVYGESSYGQQNSLLSLEPAGPTSFVMVPKSEPIGRGIDYSNVGRIGLNLGGRTYFASSEDDFVSRLYRRSRMVEPGPVNSPRCQAEGCHADLSNSKHYHRRHKVCEYHSKAATVISAGLTQRFCQQCSRFHILSEFDNGKRSCRKRLADHNRRRRKSHHQLPPPPPILDQEYPNNKSPPDNIASDSQKNTARSPAESGAHSSSLTVAVSPPRMTLDRFKQRSYQFGNNSTTSASLIFFSTE